MRRQHLAVFMLFVRSSFNKILGVLALMVLAESVWFCHTRNRLDQKLLEGEITVLTPEVVFESAKIGWFCLCALLVVLILVLGVGWSAGAKVEYTLDRLSISRKSVFIWQFLYNSGCFFLLWAVQAAAAFGLCLYYIKTADAAAVTNQSLFLAFYRNSFLHMVLPLEGTFCWAKNIIWILVLGMASAGDTYRARRGKHSLWCFWALSLGSIFFLDELGETGNLIAVLFALGLALVILWRCIWKGGEKTDEK